MRNPTYPIVNKLLAGATLLAGLHCSNVMADYSNTVASYNPVGYWRFDDATASPALKRVANLGSLGSVADGYAAGSAVLGAPGALGTCVKLNNLVGAGSCESKIDVPHNWGLNISGPFTLEHWVKLDPAAVADATGNASISSLMNDFAAANRSGFLFYIRPTGIVEFRLGNLAGYVG